MTTKGKYTEISLENLFVDIGARGKQTCGIKKCNFNMSHLDKISSIT